MTETIGDLEKQRAELIRRMNLLGDFRSGSVTQTIGRCGKINCHCHKSGQRGHGPHYRITYKVRGKTVTETLSSKEEILQARREVEEFRKFQVLCRSLVDVNVKICRQRHEEGRNALHDLKKKLRQQSKKK